MADRTWDMSQDRTELKVLQELLDEPGATVEHAVDSILGFTAASIAEAARHPKNSQEAGEFCVETRAEALACEVLELAVSLTPERQCKLVEFLVQLQTRQMYDPATSKPIQIDGMGFVWTDMPTLQGSVFRRYQDFAYSADQRPDPRDPETTTRQQCIEWANFHAFLAQLTQAAPEANASGRPSEAPFVPLYFGHRLADTLQAALEEGGGTNNKNNNAAVLARSAAARAACTSLIYGAQALFDRAAGRKTDYVPDVIPLPLECKITRARWDTWRDGLRRLYAARADDGDDEMASLMDRALAEMERVQGAV